MAQQQYNAGDEVDLRANFAGVRSEPGRCRIVDILPVSDRGEFQYKVRFEDEKFDRKILGSDIVRRISAQSPGSRKPSVEGSWLNSSRIRVGK